MGEFVSSRGFSSTDPDECLRRINDRLTKATGELRTLDLLVITWGTAWVYRYTRENIVVSNCHKIPSQGLNVVG